MPIHARRSVGDLPEQLGLTATNTVVASPCAALAPCNRRRGDALLSGAASNAVGAKKVVTIEGLAATAR